MQKKLIALAIAGLSSAAFAQTNVTIYGVADASFDFIKVSGGNGIDGTPNFNRVSTNGSHIGFKGTENLGNGLSAIFQFESEANFDTGSALGTSRDSFVGLSGNFGKVLLGNLTGPTRALGVALDVNAGDADGIGSNSAILGKLGGSLANGGVGYSTPPATRSATTSSLFDTRFNNSIAYISPSFSGLQATAMYVANENKSETAGAEFDSTAYDLGLNYNNGPVMVGLTYGKVSEEIGGVTPEDLDISETRLGGMYDFGNATVRAVYARTKLEENIAGDEIKQNVWGLGGTYNVTVNGRITAQYYKAKDLDTNSGNDDNTGAKFYSLGYEHSLSKRTMLKANYAYLKNDSNTTLEGGYDFGRNSAGFVGDNIKVSGFQFGVRHAF
ncbi:MAG: porin [Rugosibacter sp.]|nr:porin [Rugosibacter sp.]